MAGETELKHKHFLDDIELGIGNWAWGDTLLWQQGKRYGDADSRAAFDASLAAGIKLIDSAEMYGFGRSEALLGRFMRETGRRPLVATKFMPWPWRLRSASLSRALRASLERLGLESVDLYQIHWPTPPVPIATWMHALAGVVEAGLARAAGVSNYSVTQMLQAQGVLAGRGVALASNQVEYSLLQRAPERSGVFDACRRLGIRLIAYSPLAKGMLTGKYTPENPPPGPRGSLYTRAYLARLQPLIGLMVEVGQAHGGKTPAQVALNWTICKGALPIPGARDAAQAAMNAGATGWRLAGDEVAALDAASRDVQRE
ncbi:MAG: aldo/keto reductase [Anaerolineae bacterium]|nr:aldo/keto reductase [Anaerolineae bacterium]